MSIATIFACVSCSDIKTSAEWYQRLFGKEPIRCPHSKLVEWQFTDSAEVQLHEQPEHAGHTNLTLGVIPMEPERLRLLDAGLEPGVIEETEGYFTMRLRDPDGNEILFASARR